MLILSSPAKTLDYTIPYQSPFQTQPLFLKDAVKIMELLKKLTKKEIEQLMSVSSEIAEVNYQRFKVWNEKHTLENSRPAIVAYAGDIFRQIHENEYTEQQAQYLQDSLRIISGLYGLVRPYDLIQPYRLEMNVALKNETGPNLYAFWNKTLTEYLNTELKDVETPLIIDLASEEYTKAINFKEIQAPVIHVIFLQQKKKETVNIGLLSKKARGMMIDFIAKNRIYDPAQLETFTEGGYTFTAKTPDTLIFTHTLQP